MFASKYRRFVEDRQYESALKSILEVTLEDKIPSSAKLCYGDELETDFGVLIYLQKSWWQSRV